MHDAVAHALQGDVQAGHLVLAAVVEHVVGKVLAVDHRLVDRAVDHLLQQHVGGLAPKFILLQRDVVQDVFLLGGQTPQLFDLGPDLFFRCHVPALLRARSSFAKQEDRERPNLCQLSPKAIASVSCRKPIRASPSANMPFGKTGGSVRKKARLAMETSLTQTKGAKP